MRLFVSSEIFSRRRLWYSVSYAADRSTKTAPVISTLWNPSSMCWVRFRSWVVVDLSGRNPACWGMISGSMTGESLWRIRCSNSLYGWHNREMGRKLFECAGSLPGFRRAMILVFLQIFGMFFVTTQLFIRSKIHFCVTGPKCLIFSVKMLSRPMALQVLRLLMLVLSSSMENGSVSPVVWECFSHYCRVGAEGSLLIFFALGSMPFCHISCLNQVLPLLLALFW